MVGAEFITDSINQTYIHTLAAIMGSLGLLFGWQLLPKRAMWKYGSYFQNFKIKSSTRWLYIMVIVAILSQYLYTLDYGGFIGYFEYNRMIRSGIFYGFDRSKFSFLKPFGHFATLACLAFWGLLISNRKNTSIVIGFTISLIFSCYVIYASAGRVSMMSFLAILPISLAIKYKANYLTFFVAYFAIAASGITSLYVISNLLGLKGAENIQFYAIREASFPFTSFFANLREGFLFHTFWEIFISPLHLVPSSLTSSWLLDASVTNTTIIMGAPKGEYGVTGSIPTDMLTFGLMQFHFLGVVIYAVFLGYLLRVVSEIAGSFSVAGLSYTFSAYVMIRIGVFSIFYSHPKHIIMSHFSIIAALLAIVFLRMVARLQTKSRLNPKILKIL